MRVNLVRLAIVLVLIAIGLTLFGGPFVIGAGGWPIIEDWSVQFWSLVAATISFPLFDIARRTKSDEEADVKLKGLLKFYRLPASIVVLLVGLSNFAQATLLGTLTLLICLAVACYLLLGPGGPGK